MNKNMLSILNRIVAEQGEGILADAKRLFPYFSDYAKNEQKEERAAFGRCIEMGAYQELKKTRTLDERQQVKAALATQMNAKTGIARPRCVDALDLLEAVIFKTQPQYSPQPQSPPQQAYQPQPQYPPQQAYQSQPQYQPQQAYPPQPQYPPQQQSPPQQANPSKKIKRKTLIIIAAAVAAVIVVVVIITNSNNGTTAKTKAPVQNTQSSAPATAPAPTAPAQSSSGTTTPVAPTAPVEIRPRSQILFDNVILFYSEEFNKAANELQESVLRKERAKAIAALNMGLYVEDWVGTLDNFGTNTEGKAYIKIRLSRYLNVNTMNNAFSDMLHDTLIEMDSDIYQVLLNLKKGQRVRFSGSLFKADDDFYYETSMTIYGAMTDSDFLMRFTDIKPF